MIIFSCYHDNLLNDVMIILCHYDNLVSLFLTENLISTGTNGLIKKYNKLVYFLIKSARIKTICYTVNVPVKNILFDVSRNPPPLPPTRLPKKGNSGPVYTTTVPPSVLPILGGLVHPLIGTVARVPQNVVVFLKSNRFTVGRGHTV
jgi:hypothetical protein